MLSIAELMDLIRTTNKSGLRLRATPEYIQLAQEHGNLIHIARSEFVDYVWLGKKQEHINKPMATSLCDHDYECAILDRQERFMMDY